MQKYRTLENVTTQEEADNIFELLIQDRLSEARAQNVSMSREEAAAIEKHNIGYYGGYCDNDVRARLETLFNCVHPIFGSVEQSKNYTPEEIFKMGEKMAEDLQNGVKPQYKKQPEYDKPKPFAFNDWLET